jgi:uncharacterized protein (TIGR03435 family)
MKRHNENLRDVFDRHMPPAPTGALEDAAGRVLVRLREGRHHEVMNEELVMSRPRIGLRFAVAATLILTVSLGVYAYRAQRASAPKVAIVPAQSSAATEPPQVAVLTPGSAKPEAAPSREEILRGVAAQIAAAQATDSGATRPKFAAASVRKVGFGVLANNGFKCLGIDGLWEVERAIPGRAEPPRGRCVGDVVSLPSIVYGAFSSNFARWEPPSSPPMGLSRDLANMYFQINAVADNPERATKAELRLMLQALLEDRFKARVHIETRERDGYVLTIAKSGIKFKETSGEPSCKQGARFNTPGVEGKCRLKTLEEFLTGHLDGLPAFDKTGLMGIYDIDFALEFAGFGGRGGGRDGGGGAPQQTQYTTPIPKALEDQLGLHLERGKVPVEFVVVDHIEAPTEN